jgi:hypothetical protein
MPRHMQVLTIDRMAAVTTGGMILSIFNSSMCRSQCRDAIVSAIDAASHGVR